LSLCASLMLTVILSGAILDFYGRYKSESYTKRIILAKERGNWQEVLNLYDEGHSDLAQYDNLISTPVVVYRAEACIRLNNVRQALEDFKKAVKLHPWHTYAVSNLGSCYHLTGKTELAKQCYRKSLQITPGFLPSINNLKKIEQNI